MAGDAIPIEIRAVLRSARVAAIPFFDQVTDGDHKVPQYLVLFSENSYGMPFDYNQIRVHLERQTTLRAAYRGTGSVASCQ